MENTKRSILVAWDFSTVADYALGHALIFADNVDAVVTLVHMVKKGSQIDEANAKMATAADEFEKEKGKLPQQPESQAFPRRRYRRTEPGV